MTGGQRIHDLVPDASPPPTNDPLEPKTLRWCS